MSLAAIVLLTLWRAIGGPEFLAIPMAVASVALVAAEFEHIPPGIRRMVWILLALSAAAFPFALHPAQALLRGILLSGLLISLIGAVTLVARCAYRSPELRALGERLRTQPPARRYFAFTMASQLFSAMLSLAGTNLLFVMACERDPHGGGECATGVVPAITRGFSAAIFWSPMFGNMAILLALYPSLTWPQVFPLGLLIAQVTVLIGVVMHSGRSARKEMPTETPPDAGVDAGKVLLPLVGALVFFFLAVLTASHALGISITAAIVLCAVPVTYLLNSAMARGPARWSEGRRSLALDLRTLSAIGPEAALFTSAGCSGTVLAAAFPPEWATSIAALVASTPFAAVGALIVSLIVLSVAGVHPVLSAIFLASTFTPSQLGLPSLVHFCAVLTGWGLAASLTPFSVLSMSASRYSGMNIYRVSLGENWRFAVACTLVAALVLSWAARA